jgi:alkylhydroperoxidase/carboxymuconolactone decarboxylase family protein YurZ
MPFPHAYRRLGQEHPEVVRSYEALGDAVRAAGPLEGKTLALVKLALALGSGLEGGAHSAVRKAIEAGCTREELLHVALLGTTTMGFPAMMRARSWVLDVLDGKPNVASS